MARTFTVAQIRNRVRELTDTENSRNLSDTELNSRISSAYAKYYCKLVKVGIAYPSEVVQNIVTTGANTYPLPGDHFATLRVDYQYQPSYFYELDEIDVREVTDFQWPGSYAFCYRLAGGNILLYPLPTAGGLYLHTYVPAPADLTQDLQTVDGVAGWEDAIVLDAAIRALMKGDDDVANLLRERDIVDARIDEEAEMRSLTRSRHIVRRHAYGYNGDAADWPPWSRGT